MKQTALGRLTVDQRRQARREGPSDPVLSTQQAFERWERVVLKEMERRRAIRRAVDVRSRLARVS